METVQSDLVVIGAGSGGLGAALTGARLGLSVLLVEKATQLGGAAVQGGVHCWEMGAGGTGMPFDIYRRLKRIPGAVGIYSYGRHMSWWKPEREAHPYPGGERVLDAERRYLDTLQRHGAPGGRPTEEFSRRVWHGVVFEPDEYGAVLETMLSQTGRCRILKETVFTDVVVEDGQVRSLLLSDGTEVIGGTYVDSTGDALFCRLCGCPTAIGQDAQALFAEPGAPPKATRRVNGVTLVYRVTPVADPGVESLPPGIPEDCWWQKSFPVVSCNHYPQGDINVNMLPTMEGEQFLGMAYGAAYQECRRRVLAHWHHLQLVCKEFRDYRLKWIAPVLGVRETHRTVCEKMLTEQDVRAGISRQRDPDIVCIADHALDTHGAVTGRQGCAELEMPYGVPLRCLIPKGFKNLLVACRGAGFTSLAASSCRLSRTMMQLGQAAGAAAALRCELSAAVGELPAERLRQLLREQHVQVDWPMPAELRDWLQDEEAP